MKLKNDPRKLKALAKGPRMGAADGLDFACERFMSWMRKEYPGKKAEISAAVFAKRTDKFANALSLPHPKFLFALQVRGWVEPSAADTYLLRYDLVRR